MSTLEMESKLAVPDLMLSETRIIAAPRARVYEAWTNPDSLKVWLPPGNMAVPSISVDPRVGGAYRIAMQGTLDVHNGVEVPDQSSPIVVAEGVYRDLIQDSRLCYTWKGSWNPAEETEVTATFADHPSGTVLTIEHRGFQTEQSLATHRSGWQSSLTKLAGLTGSTL